MKSSKRNSTIIYSTIILAIVLALPFGQTAAAKSTDAPDSSTTQWSVQVDRVDPANLTIASSFQIAIYENLLEELNKTKRFNRVLRDGDRTAAAVPNLLALKTTVTKFVPGSETKRAVTTVSGATKVTVHTQLVARDGQIVFERRIDGSVRFFGSNLRATHNLARNIAKAIKQSSWSTSGQMKSS
jgi:hypothetical protein